jgi:hypothetical protein
MRNTISVVLLVLLFILTPVMALTASARFNVLTVKFLTRELVRLDVYNLAVSQIDKQIGNVQLDPKYLVTHAELAALAHQVITPQWLRQTIEGNLGRLEEWLQSEPGTTLSIPIDLRQPKASLTDGVDALLTEKLPMLEPCPDRRIPKEEQGICQFAGLTLPELKEQLRQAGLNPDVIAGLLPDTLDLLNPDLSKITGVQPATPGDTTADKTQEIKKSLDLVKARYQQVIFLMNLSFGIFGLLVALYLALNAMHGWHRFTRWGGVLLLMIGLLPYALAVASSLAVEQALLPKLHIDAKVPAEVARLAPIAIRDVRKALFDPLLVFGAIGMVVGLGGIVGAHWIKTPVVKKRV